MFSTSPVTLAAPDVEVADDPVRSVSESVHFQDCLIQRACPLEQVWKTWKLLAQSNRVAEEVCMDVLPPIVVTCTKTKSETRIRRRACDALSEEQSFNELCCAFQNLSIPWCEIHTRRGKLCARDKSDDDLALGR